MAAVAPPGLDLHADQRGRIVSSVVVISIITITSVALRFLSRRLAKAGYWWDDYLCLAALFTSLICASLCVVELRNGYGRHVYIIPPQDLEEKMIAFLKVLWVFNLCIGISIVLSKLAILAFYYRIFFTPHFRQMVLWFAVFCSLYLVVISSLFIFQCRPVHFAWDQAKPDSKGHCLDLPPLLLGIGVVNAVLNLVIFILPLPLLVRLSTTVKQRILIMAIFTLAGFVIVVSIIWVTVLAKNESIDITWTFINSGIWSTLEPNVAVICACIPSLHPLFRVLGRGFSSPPLKAPISSSTGTNSSLKRMWGSRIRETSSNFSQLGEVEDLRPLGHGVMVRGGRFDTDPGGEEDAAKLPQNGIRVQTEVTLTTSDRLDYNDRLF